MNEGQGGGLPPAIYEQELEELRAQVELQKAFFELLERLEDPELKRALCSLRSAGDNLLDPEKLVELRRNNPDLYNRIYPVYVAFLREKSGF